MPVRMFKITIYFVSGRKKEMTKFLEDTLTIKQALNPGTGYRGISSESIVNFFNTSIRDFSSINMRNVEEITIEEIK